MKYFKNLAAVFFILITMASCVNEDIVIKTQEYILLKSKTETLVSDNSKYVAQTQYIYDTLSTQPTLKQEITNNEIIEYSYPSENMVITKNIDRLTESVENTTTYTIDPKNRNVLSQIDDFGTDGKFSYNSDGYLTKSDFEEGTTYEYSAGNLSKKTVNYDDYAYTETFSYGSEVLKLPINAAFLYGTPNKNILTKQVNSTVLSGNISATQTETITTTLDARGYVLTQRRTYENGEYLETKYEYKIFKK